MEKRIMSTAPPWAQSCANPLKPYPAKGTQPSYPAYPGHPLTSQQQWQDECLGPLPQYGNCAFQYYAAHPGGPAIPGYPGGSGISCGSKTTRVNIEASTAHDEDATYKTVCFDNPKDVGDRLCIFQSFAVGNVNVEEMEPSTRAAALAALIEGVGHEMELGPKMFCLHHGDEASVGWTHLHTFTPPPPPSAWPDGLAPSNAYCAAWQGSAASTAQALDAQVRARRL
jgi:hypothetical protein